LSEHSDIIETLVPPKFFYKILKIIIIVVYCRLVVHTPQIFLQNIENNNNSSLLQTRGPYRRDHGHKSTKNG